jgi:hypothetical protein
VATKVNPQYAGCDSDNTGRISYGKNEEGDPNYSATFYRNSALLPLSSYELTLDLQVHIRNNGKLEPYLFKNQYVEQTETVKFETGECISVLSKGNTNDDAILSSYPYEGQRYFMKGENAQTFIKLKTKMNCCLTNLNSDKNFDLKVRFTPLEGYKFADGTPAVLLADATFKEDRVIYTMPAGLKNKTLYRFQLVRIPNDSFVKEQLAEALKAKASAKKITSGNIYVNASGKMPLEGAAWKSGNQHVFPGTGSSQADKVNSKYNNYYDKYTEISEEAYEKIALGYGTLSKITAGTEKLYGGGLTLKITNDNTKEEVQLAKKLEMVMYRYYFKTSQFNTLSEKVNAAQFPLTETSPWGKLGDALTTKMVSKEGFDSYEMEAEHLGGDSYRPPLILMKADPASHWFKNIAEPVADLLARIPPNFYSEGANGNTKPFATKEEAVDLFRRAMVMFNNHYDAIQRPFTTNDIINLIPSEKKK